MSRLITLTLYEEDMDKAYGTSVEIYSDHINKTCTIKKNTSERKMVIKKR